MSSAESGRPGPERARPESWRFLITPRWIGWHLAMLVAVAGMLALGWWQLRRAEEGNALSWAYTFEWPIFAVFAVVFWAKTIRDEFSPPDADQAPGRAGLAAGGAVPSPPAGQHGEPGTAGAGPGDEDEDLAAYNAYLARLQDQVKNHGRWHGLR